MLRPTFFVFLTAAALSAPGVALAVDGIETQDKTEAVADSAPMSSGSYLSGSFARESGDTDEAARYLEDAFAANPADERLAGQLLVLYLSGGDFDKAAEQARNLKKIGTKEKVVDIVLAVAAVGEGDYAEAQTSLQAAYGEGGATLWLPLLRSWLSLGSQGRLKKPVRASDILPKKQKQMPSFLAYHLALINDKAGFPVAAAKGYEQAIADYGKAPFRAVEAAADFYRRAGNLERLAQIRMDYLGANPTMSALVDSDASSQMTALIAREAGGETRLVDTVPHGIAEILFTMASVIYSVDAEQDAELYLRLALHLRPDFPLAQLLLGNILESQDRFADATEVYDGINPQSPLFARSLLRKAFVIEGQGKLSEAIAMLDERIRLHPDETEPYVAKGDLLRSRGRFAEAAEAYSEAIDRLGEPEAAHWGLFFARGACFERSGEWERAQADLKRALELNPDQPEVLNYLGYSLLVKGRENVDRARGMIEQAYSLQPDSPHIIDSLGWAYYVSGDLENAVKYLEQAIALMPGDATVNDHLGDAYWQTGRKTEAKYQWERALTYKPEAAQETAIHRKLKEGLAPLPVAATAPDHSSSLSATTPDAAVSTN